MKSNRDIHNRSETAFLKLLNCHHMQFMNEMQFSSLYHPQNYHKLDIPLYIKIFEGFELLSAPV